MAGVSAVRVAVSEAVCQVVSFPSDWEVGSLTTLLLLHVYNVFMVLYLRASLLLQQNWPVWWPEI